MRIAVCVKLVPNPRAPVFLDRATRRVAGLENTPLVVNPADLVGLEMALRIKEQNGAELVLLTVGSFVPERRKRPADITLLHHGLRNNVGRLRAPDPLRRCLAMGTDRAIAIGLNRSPGNVKKESLSTELQETSAHYGFRPANIESMITAQVLAKSIERINADLVFCGDHSYDCGDGMVGPAIAELLDMAFISAVLDTNLETDRSSLRVTRRLEKGTRELVRCILPAVLAVDTGVVTPRYFQMPALINSFNIDIETLNPAALGISIKELIQIKCRQLLGLSYPRPRTKKTSMPGSSLSPAMRARMIMSGGAPKDNKKGQVLEGSADRAADEVIKFLEDHGILLGDLR